jgi:hypothetical protein
MNVMDKSRSRLLTQLLLFALLLIVPSLSARAAPSTPDVPQGFELISASMGVRLYQKDYEQGTPDFLQVVDLSKGASLELLHGAIQQPRLGRGAYGGPDPKMRLESLEYYWKDFASETSNPFCVTNGLFFYMPENPTRLPFPLKKDGEIVTDGYGGEQFPNQKLMLEIWQDTVDIRKLSRQALYSSTAPDILAGLTPDANKRANQYTGRTFVGVDDRNGDRQYEIFLVYNTKTARQSDAAQVLKNAGADKVMMLDGGGSTQLICQGNRYVDSDRLIPQALGVAGADVPVVAVEFTVDEWQVITQGESLQVEIPVTNAGASVWKPGQVQILISQKSWEQDEAFPIEAPVLPGEGTSFTWRTGEFSNWGIFRAQVSLVEGGQYFPPQPRNLGVVVLPKDLENRKADLLREIERWEQADDMQGMEERIVDWLKQELGASQEPIAESGAVFEDEVQPLQTEDRGRLRISTLICLPLLMLPFLAGLVLLLRKRGL